MLKLIAACLIGLTISACASTGSETEGGKPICETHSIGNGQTLTECR